MLEVNQLSRRYDEFVAVDNVSFTVDRGEIVGLLGHNGAGKTTIMKMLSGYLEPNSGTVTVDGLSIAEHPQKVQAGLGYLPESLPLYPEMTVADYLDYSAELKGLDGENRQRELRRVIGATDIAAKLLAPIGTLSRGYKQRVGVAQAILGRPKLLILDEPTNGLDPGQTQHMRQLIRELARDATVLLSTHIMQEVGALCSRVLILRAGQLAVDSELEALRQSDILLVETTLPIANAGSLKDIDGVVDVSGRENGAAVSYRITLRDNADNRQVRASIAKQLMEAGQDLYLLQPEHRDLETLFREVNEADSQQESLSDAA